MTQPSPAPDPGRADTRGALLDATMRVVAERGLRGLTHRAVAEAAGVTHGLVRHYFGTVDALLLEALAVQVARDIEAAPPRMSGPLETLADHVPGRVAETEPDQAFQYEVSLESRRRPELSEHVQRSYASYTDAMRERMTRGGLPDDPALARVVFAAVDGLALQQVLFASPEQTEEGLVALRRMLLALRRVEAEGEGNGGDGAAGGRGSDPSGPDLA
jgi:TetR/AcrR family transcriptional regulator, regulator of biofilm formation and stress response